MRLYYDAKVEPEALIGQTIAVDTTGSDLWVVTAVKDDGDDVRGVTLILERPTTNDA